MGRAFRWANVMVQGRLAGTLSETESGYRFKYHAEYLENDPLPVSLTLPIREEAYESNVLFPFFDGLIPEGWLLNAVSHRFGIPEKDRFGILLRACHDPIGNVSLTVPGEEE